MTGTAQQIISYLWEQDRTKQWDLKEHKQKRTLTQNAYYWQLLTHLAKKLHISTNRMHNILLRDCAPPFILDGKVAMQPIPDTEKAMDEILESETFHLKPTSGIIVGQDGLIYRWCIILRGSSTFNTDEMSALVDLLIQECKQQGIETLPPHELEAMRQRAKEIEQKKQVQQQKGTDS